MSYQAELVVAILPSTFIDEWRHFGGRALKLSKTDKHIKTLTA